jgi:hypothetical protein
VKQVIFQLPTKNNRATSSLAAVFSNFMARVCAGLEEEAAVDPSLTHLGFGFGGPSFVSSLTEACSIKVCLREQWYCVARRCAAPMRTNLMIVARHQATPIRTNPILVIVIFVVTFK